MFLAALTKELPIPAEQMFLLNILGLVLLFAGILVYRRMLRRVGIRGGLVRSDLLGLPDALVSATLATLLILLVAMQWILPPNPPKPPDGSGAGGPSGLQIIYGALQFALPVAAILALLIARGVGLTTLFGLRRVGLLRAVGTAVGLILMLLPIFILVTAVAYHFLQGHAEPQELVKVYQKAAKSGKSEILWQVMVAAVVIAPITEEVLFRGYFYPVLKKYAGPLASAVAVSLLFGAVHNNALGMPGLTLLALALTLSYEWSGSIFVPMFMHASFNAISLLAMWWATQNGVPL